MFLSWLGILCNYIDPLKKYSIHMVAKPVKIKFSKRLAPTSIAKEFWSCEMICIWMRHNISGYCWKLKSYLPSFLFCPMGHGEPKILFCEFFQGAFNSLPSKFLLQKSFPLWKRDYIYNLGFELLGTLRATLRSTRIYTYTKYYKGQHK